MIPSKIAEGIRFATQAASRRRLGWLVGLCWYLIVQTTGLAQVMRTELHDEWRLSRLGQTDFLPARVPGAIHADLIRAGRIPNPFFGDQALRQGWVDSCVWIYRCRFPFPDSMANRSHPELVFEGLDTRADVYIEDRLVLVADNMFRSWRIPLDPFRQYDSLDLSVVIYPAILHGAGLAQTVPWSYPADSDPYSGKPSVFMRKAPYQFGWDFAPPMPGGGIWRPVRLEAWSGLRLQDPWVETLAIDERGADVRIRLHWWSDHKDSVQIDWVLGEWRGSQRRASEPGENQAVVFARLEGAAPWWPRGEGDQVLYPLEVVLRGKDGLDRSTTRAGLRTVRLDQSPDDWGTGFRFVVNGRPVFCQGANWVPADMFPGRVDEEKYEHLLGLAADAGMNMLRVWGGGIYEHERFYELADSLGIMIWQDFMFAGTMYPGDNAFVENVREEAIGQIRRLRGHPCMALWCGNNEVEVAWANWGWQAKYGYSADQQERMMQDYHRLFRELLPTLVIEGHPGMDYLSSSPVSNWGDRADLDHGNNHFWGVWHGEMALDSLGTRVARFMSEYGMPSYPTWESLSGLIDPVDRYASSPGFSHRMRSYKGIRLLESYMLDETGSIPQDLEAWVAAGHQVQAKALEIAIRAHLADRPRCAGTLLWQFNEPWPGVSWSIVDHYGRLKPAYNTVKRLFTQR